MKLAVMDRLQLQGILPKEGDHVTLKIVRKLREALSFSEQEIKDLGFLWEFACPVCGVRTLASAAPTCPKCSATMANTNKIVWDTSKDPNKDVFMGRTAETLCRNALKKLSDDKKLGEEKLSLFEKFCPDEDKEDDGK